MGLSPRQLREYVVVPAMIYLHPDVPQSAAGIDMVMGTAAHESGGFKYIDQLTPGPGPAYGLWQMERATHDDLWLHWLSHRPALHAKMKSLLADWPNPVEQLRSNLIYAAAMCRIGYRRSPVPLPERGDVQGYARMWKQVWNTRLGKGTEAQFVKHYEQMLTEV